MGRVGEVRYVTTHEYLQFDENALIDAQYTQYPNEVAEDPPPVVIASAVSTKPGSYRTESSLVPGMSYKEAAQTALVFLEGGIDDEQVIPLTRASERTDIPEVVHAHVTTHAMLVMVNEEAPERIQQIQQILSHSHTYRMMPHTGLFASEQTKEIYRRRQIGQDPPIPPPRRVLTPSEAIGPDGVSF